MQQNNDQKIVFLQCKLTFKMTGIGNMKFGPKLSVRANFIFKYIQYIYNDFL